MGETKPTTVAEQFRNLRQQMVERKRELETELAEINAALEGPRPGRPIGAKNKKKPAESVTP